MPISVPRTHIQVFNSSNPNWTGSAEQNHFFVDAIMKHLVDKLLAEGHLFLNDVYDALGFEQVQSGQYIGWTKNLDYDFTTEGVGPGEIKLVFRVEGEIINALKEG